MREIIRPLERHKDWLRKITAGNGKEVADDAEAALDLDMYVARWYQSSEQGLSERTNGLERSYQPERKEFNHVPPEAVEQVQGLLSNRCPGAGPPRAD